MIVLLTGFPIDPPNFAIHECVSLCFDRDVTSVFKLASIITVASSRAGVIQSESSHQGANWGREDVGRSGMDLPCRY